MEENVLTLGDHRFPIDEEKGTLGAFVSNATDFQLFWMIDVKCRKTEVAINGETRWWQPNIYWETMAISVRDWRRLEGQAYRTASPSVLSKIASLLRNDPTARRDMRPGIYLDSHEGLDSAKVCFASRRGLSFDIEWSFIWADVAGYIGPSEPNEVRLPGIARTTVRFTNVGLWLKGVDTKEKAKARLAQDLDVALFHEPTEGNLDSTTGPSFTFTPIT